TPANILASGSKHLVENHERAGTQDRRRCADMARTAALVSRRSVRTFGARRPGTSADLCAWRASGTFARDLRVTWSREALRDSVWARSLLMRKSLVSAGVRPPGRAV